MREGQDTTEDRMIIGKSTIKEGGLHHMKKKREGAESHHHLLHLTLPVHHLWDHHLQRNLQISRKKLKKSD
jgi:hypothetical protein